MRNRKGIAFAIGAAVLFGVSAPAAKALLATSPPQLLAGLLYLGSGLGLGLLSALRSGARRRSEARLTSRDAPWLGSAIFFGGVLGPVLLLVGLSRTPASSASLLLNLEAVFTALIAWTVFHENVDRRVALGMLAIVVGGLVLSWQGSVASVGAVGALAIAGACACWAIDNNFTQQISGGDPVQIAMLKGIVAGVVNTGIALALGTPMPKVLPVAAALALGFVSYGLSLALFVSALRYLGTARTAAYFSVAPFVGAAVSLMVWREQPATLFWIGAGCMAIGVWLHLTERHEHLHVHEEMVHTHAHVHDEHHQHEHGPDDPPGEPHSHEHRHRRLAHSHVHYPDIHHRHTHDDPLASD